MSVFEDDKLNGLSQNWNKEGVLVFEGEYLDGMRHGIFNKYYDDGRPHLEQSFAYDKLDGQKKKYDEEGQCTVSNYEAGILVR